MSLQNRVDPFGQIHGVAARGLFTGNRGIIHDPATKTLTGRRWTTKAWIICACAYKGRRREVMGYNGRNGGAGWTELFFLDEVTSLAAGHRPCFECRREAAKAYAGAFGRAFGVTKPTVQMMDARLHAERLASTRDVPPSSSQGMTETIGLPDGTMIQSGRTAYALGGGRALPWSFDGYGDSVPLSAFGGRKVSAITPATTIAVLREGFNPIWHPSAFSQTS
ncbi:hypothetical protein ABMA32_06200 [Mesorhizobium sp. VNQ89]|uniref:hypothetical protein n=1 Tax=Mesorhizobium quangtriensis TaxID=3157709 RepID=UPI0032B78E93